MKPGWIYRLLMVVCVPMYVISIPVTLVAFPGSVLVAAAWDIYCYIRWDNHPDMDELAAVAFWPTTWAIVINQSLSEANKRAKHREFYK